MGVFRQRQASATQFRWNCRSHVTCLNKLVKILLKAGVVLNADNSSNEALNVVSVAEESSFDQSVEAAIGRAINSGSELLQQSLGSHRPQESGAVYAPHVTTANDAEPREAYIVPLELELNPSGAAEMEAVGTKPKLNSGASAEEQGGSRTSEKGDESGTVPTEVEDPEPQSDVSPVKNIPIKSAINRRDVGNSLNG